MSDTSLIDIIAPEAGESVSEATVLDWLVGEGEKVEEGQPLLEVSTDKVDMELPAPAGGTIAEMLVSAGDVVTPGQILGRINTEVGSVNASTEPPAEKVLQQPKTSPVAERVAQVEEVDINQVEGTGLGGRVTKADVLAAKDGFAERVRPAKPTSGQAKESDLRGAAAQLAQYMSQSLSIPTATSFRPVTVTQMAGRREQLKGQGHKISFTHILAYAITQAASQMPQMAHHFETMGTRQMVVSDGQINLGVAVDVEKKDGSRTLMVPVITGADSLDFSGFVEAFSLLIEKARTNSLSPDDLQGANMTLTNPGGIGTVYSVPRLMPGQGTIIASGAIGYPAGFEHAGQQLGVEKTMGLTSTYDHRIIQGAESGRFLALVDSLLQGEEEFYEQIFSALGASLGPRPSAPQPQAQTGYGSPDPGLLKAVYKATSLVRSYRTHGHLAAHLDPLGSAPKGDPSLSPSSVDLSEELMRQIPADTLNLQVPGETLADALPHLRDVYCGTISYEFEHITSHEQRDWFRRAAEAGDHLQKPDSESQKRLLKRLIAVDALERFLHKSYLGQKQFSIEGLDMTVPMLDRAIELAHDDGAQEVIIGMAHRGRLNVLAHNLGRPYNTIFGEFEGGTTVEVVQEVTDLPQHGTGDVKYHHGYSGHYKVPGDGEIEVHLESNPSHLEFVDPVVLGAARASQSSHDGPTITRDRHASVPVILHGDAAFPGQGVVAETLNLQALDGYETGGALHLVQNNQVGFTTDPDDSRSTHWASDLAKGFDVPIIHVNADDAEACIGAVNLAMDYRSRFGHDALIDLVGYRRFGHNEADEPAYTQPQMYEKIKNHKRACEIYADQLVGEGVVSSTEVEAWASDAWEALSVQYQELKEKVDEALEGDEDSGTTLGIFDQQYPDFGEPFAATPSAEELTEINQLLTEVPDSFSLHRKLDSQMKRRLEGIQESVDWAQAEALAFGSLLRQGIPIRLTGQDAERGTFSHRHMVFHSSDTGEDYSPVQNLPGAKASFEIHNSPLSEAACLGFEYGYAMEKPDALVLWEAQFGDFANGAQVIVDQFISSGLSKWGDSSRLTLLLPHGYEGAGPEHSSARLERFLQLCAEGNLRVANPTTPAQYYHLLRRQATMRQQRPLVVMSPKSLLRSPAATSSLQDLAEGYFQPVIDDPAADRAAVTRLLLCSGKIYYDLAAAEQSRPEVAIVRVEQLYPFPEEEISEVLAGYPNLEEVVWVQEEPRNMGAREFMFPRLQQIIPAGFELGYIGRPERASPGEGYPAAHRAEQQRIVFDAFDVKVDVSPFPEKTPGER